MKITNNYCYWQSLVDTLETISLGYDDVENTKLINRVKEYFTVMSTEWLNRYSGADFATMWCMLPNPASYPSYKQHFEEFVNYLKYATDRMNINRWLYLHIHINEAFTKAYNAIDSNKYHHIKYPEGMKAETHYMDAFQVEAQEWFKNDFKSLYKANIAVDAAGATV